MYKDQRLIPFIGGLAIGGLSGAAFNKNQYYGSPQAYPYPTQYNYYPTPYYPAQYNYYPAPYYPAQYYYPSQIEENYYKTNNVILTADKRNMQSYDSISYVPPFYRY